MQNTLEILRSVPTGNDWCGMFWRKILSQMDNPRTMADAAAYMADLHEGFLGRQLRNEFLCVAADQLSLKVLYDATLESVKSIRDLLPVDGSGVLEMAYSLAVAYFGGGAVSYEHAKAVAGDVLAISHRQPDPAPGETRWQASCAVWSMIKCVEYAAENACEDAGRGWCKDALYWVVEATENRPGKFLSVMAELSARIERERRASILH